MDSKDLIWFQEVCRCKSITKAAASLFITPQGLSRGIRNLETELGVVLLERTPNGISLTPYGESLYKSSDVLLKDFKEILSEFEMLKQQERGFLRVCSSYGVFRILGPDFIFRFEEQNPDISLDYMEYPDLYVEEEIGKENFDVGFAVGPVKNPELEVIPMFSSPVSLLVYEGHPLSGRDRVRFSDLEGEALILESRAFKIHQLVREYCRAAGFEANIIFNTSGFSLCHKLTAQKRGISVIVDKISDDMTKQGMKRIPFEDGFRWEVKMICKEKFRNFRHIRKWKDYTMEALGKQKS